MNKSFEAAFVGRFQPFHNGHLNAIKSILDEVANLLIIIGSTQESSTEKNPFNFELREQMILESLAAESIDLSRIKIVGLPDIGDDKKWVSYLLDSVPAFKYMYTGSEETKELFDRDGRIEVRDVNFLDGVSGTLVRAKKVKNEVISELVPAVVDRLI